MDSLLYLDNGSLGIKLRGIEVIILPEAKTISACQQQPLSSDAHFLKHRLCPEATTDLKQSTSNTAKNTEYETHQQNDKQ